MKKTKFSHKTMAVFLTLAFLPSILPVNMLFASNSGPTAPEAASFEPIDATDMVNLATGDLSYVLPLMNVPSPEGGYPLSLAYHAGIAMDQEASWVGLGWNLNPGAINRSVNGYPDDWNTTSFNEILYDEGGQQNTYGFTIGGTLPNGITLGVSKSWGANRSWGGIVGYAGNSFSFGSNGFGVGTGIGPVGLNASDKGISISYTPSGYNADTGKPINPNGLGISVSKSFASKEFSVSANSKKFASGISLSSQNGLSGRIASISSSNQSLSSASQGDYYSNIISKGFGINTGIFWVSYQHTRFEYSLFKNTRYKVSGSLNPYAIIETDDNHNQKVSSIMDVKQYHVDDSDAGVGANPAFINYETLTFPNYDNYMVNSQGISGNLSPRFFEEATLVNRGNEDFRYLIDMPSNPSSYSLGNKLHFYMDNTNSSSLRIQSGKFVGPQINDPYTITFSNNNDVLFNHDTETDPTFAASFTAEGYFKKNGNRKRDGTFVESFTNKQILDDNTGVYFIEARELNRNNAIYDDDAIGAFRVTTVDGKTYHYSLPVLHFESFNKNFKELNEADSKFFESRREDSYATHWLLTAVTGPDYVDFNSNGRVDKNDYGYWVEFEYGKWSDGYVWRSPKSGYHEIPNSPNLTGNDGYKLFWGRKQVYYLDKVKTRTHTALFIKSLRNDNKSSTINEFDQRFNGSGSFDPDTYSKIYDDREVEAFTNTAGPFYTDFGSTYSLASGIYFGKKRYVKYVDAPETRSLRLDKVILVKNEYDNISKSAGNNLISQVNGKSSFNDGYFDVSNVIGQGFPNLYFSLNEVTSFSSHFEDRVLDINDIQDNSILEGNASKVIRFNYDYSLAKNSPNSNASGGGRLSLKNVEFAGKKGVSLMPPYEFAYEQPSVNYNYTNQDVWGYVNNIPEAWSLNEITTPVGGKIQIQYESDSFYAEAAYRDKTIQTVKDYTFSADATDGKWEFDEITNIQKNGDELTVFFDTSLVPTSFANSVIIGTELDLALGFKYTTQAGQIADWNKVIPYTIVEINQNNSIKLRVNESTDLSFHNQLPVVNCLANYNFPSNNSSCLKWISFSVTDGIYTDNDPNGKSGGGIRVASVSVTDGINTYKTDYGYRSPMTDKISGITSYEPFERGKNIPYIEELPAPNVMYEYVTVINLDSQSNMIQKTVYQHDVLKPYNLDMNNGETHFSLGEAFKVVKEQSIGNDFTSFDRVYKYTLHDKLASLGRLRSIQTYNKYNQLISKTLNKFKSFSDFDESQGIVQESFKTYGRHGDLNQSNPNYNISSSSRVEYPSVIEQTTFLQKNIETTTSFVKHDFLTGQVLESHSLLGDGTEVKQEKIPAYNFYPYDVSGYAMGGKTDDITNKNMLTQEAMKKSYIKNNNVWNLVGASINTWKSNSYTISSGVSQNVWHKHQNYVWDGNMDSNGQFISYSGDYDNFNWNTSSSQSSGSDWRLISKVNQYDPYSMALEIEDVNGNRASTRMGDDHTKVIATANAPLNGAYYSGAEYVKLGLFDGGIDDVGQTLERSHTGRYAIKVTSEQGFKTTLSGHNSGKYKISVWASKDNYNNARVYDGLSLKTFNGEKIIAGQWVLLNHYVDLSSSNKTIYVTSSSGTTYYDDFRIHPARSSMTSYVYNEWDELTHILGASNLATQYVYNEAGQLCSTYAEIADQSGLTGGFKIISKNKLYYKDGNVGTCSNLTGSIVPNGDIASVGCTISFGLTGSGGVANWSVNFGDGTSQNGTNNPPSSLTHSYTSLGNKTATLILTDFSGNSQSFTDVLTVVPTYYFTTNSSNSSSKNLTLHGAPGEPITYSASVGGTNSGYTGYVSVNGVGSNLPGYGSVSNVSAGVFPSSGQVSAYLSISSSSGGSAGTVTLQVKKPGNCGNATSSVTINY
ncbi:hypothetical protein MTsPCn5_16480 [Croceitalea sp. MTPC5]|uniref:PKD domain-containing protein n=1 Tax=Croceitalea sp. MTPC5 TaxID=3056565 RepID=UPI002B3D99EF|nr:hypothetical protein MTsPCn5_16480 [Croceitalea sp. MTPC5]